MMAGSFGRIGALMLRHWYLLRSSWPRLLDMIYWPTVQMLTWGFITLSMAPASGAAGVGAAGMGAGVLLAAAMLWDVLLRAQLGTTMSFLEEMYARNLGHLLASPLRPVEMLVALALVGLLRTLIGMVPTSLLAIWFFGFSVYDMGLALVGFSAALVIMGWAIALFISGLVMRVGMGAEALAWGFVFALAPLSAVFYPVSVLPEFLQGVAFALPSAHVFEGMRHLLATGVVDLGDLVTAFALDTVYLALGIFAFLRFHKSARNKGRLLQTGE